MCERSLHITSSRSACRPASMHGTAVLLPLLTLALLCQPGVCQSAPGSSSSSPTSISPIKLIPDTSGLVSTFGPDAKTTAEGAVQGALSQLALGSSNRLKSPQVAASGTSGAPDAASRLPSVGGLVSSAGIGRVPASPSSTAAASSVVEAEGGQVESAHADADSPVRSFLSSLSSLSQSVGVTAQDVQAQRVAQAAAALTPCEHVILRAPLLNSGQSGFGIDFVCGTVLCSLADAADSAFARWLVLRQLQAQTHNTNLTSSTPADASITALNMFSMAMMVQSAPQPAAWRIASQPACSERIGPMPLPAYYFSSGLRDRLAAMLAQTCGSPLGAQALAQSMLTVSELRECGGTWVSAGRSLGSLCPATEIQGGAITWLPSACQAGQQPDSIWPAAALRSAATPRAVRADDVSMVEGIGLNVAESVSAAAEAFEHLAEAIVSTQAAINNATFAAKAAAEAGSSSSSMGMSGAKRALLQATNLTGVMQLLGGAGDEVPLGPAAAVTAMAANSTNTTVLSYGDGRQMQEPSSQREPVTESELSSAAASTLPLLRVAPVDIMPDFALARAQLNRSQASAPGPVTPAYMPVDEILKAANGTSTGLGSTQGTSEQADMAMGDISRMPGGPRPIQPNSWWVAGYPTSWRAGCYCGQTPGDWSPVCSTAPPRFYPSACYARCQGVKLVSPCEGVQYNMAGWAAASAAIPSSTSTTIKGRFKASAQESGEEKKAAAAAAAAQSSQQELRSMFKAQGVDGAGQGGVDASRSSAGMRGSMVQAADTSLSGTSASGASAGSSMAGSVVPPPALWGRVRAGAGTGLLGRRSIVPVGSSATAQGRLRSAVGPLRSAVKANRATGQSQPGDSGVVGSTPGSASIAQSMVQAAAQLASARAPSSEPQAAIGASAPTPWSQEDPAASSTGADSAQPSGTLLEGIRAQADGSEALDAQLNTGNWQVDRARGLGLGLGDGDGSASLIDDGLGPLGEQDGGRVILPGLFESTFNAIEDVVQEGAVPSQSAQDSATATGSQGGAGKGGAGGMHRQMVQFAMYDGSAGGAVESAVQPQPIGRP